ncbi:UbiD family decarboxylase domain-containing protein [Catenulispora rubra]|uniref:UbiD family decarboxylase domain-containing protein n=1 Tax=Catenulispora rubra TaxID=280293 RepID=UPI003F69558B
MDRDAAPCKQNVMLGADVDLFRFPTPLIHGNDGGRYLQTYGMNIAKTPDGSWTNWSINRMMIHDARTLACLIPAPQHLGVIRAQHGVIHRPPRPGQLRRRARHRRPGSGRLGRGPAVQRPRQGLRAGRGRNPARSAALHRPLGGARCPTGGPMIAWHSQFT